MQVGRGGCSNQSTSKTINQLLEGSSVPMADSRAFHYEGQDWKSSRVEMVAGDCTKSSTTLYEWAAFPEVAFRHSGPLGILV